MDAGQGNNQEVPETRLLLAEIVGALSYALDLTEGQPAGHSLRCCWIGMHIGRALALPRDALADLYYVLLLKDIGCSSNAARLCELYACDDRVVKRNFKRVNTDSLLQLGRFVIAHAGPGASLKARIQRILRLAQNGEELARELITTRCERGASIALRLGFNEAVADGIRCLDEHWNGKGKPAGLRRRQIPVASRIALLAQVVDVFHAAGDPAAALKEVRARTGTWFDPAVVSALETIAREDGFWAGLADAGLQERVVKLEPDAGAVTVNEDRLDQIAEAFAQVIDAKSPYTYGHGGRVARYAEAIACQLQLPPDRRRWLRRGALLHDIGKLGVSNAILDKPGRLEGDEWPLVQAHARYSEEILGRLSLFRELACVAAAHHERLDGQGYPRGLGAAQISLETRIITTADIFDALTAARPYRGALPIPQALAIMERQVGAAIDPACLAALKICLAHEAIETGQPADF